MYKVAVIADDFSSVTDCGGQFSKRGIRTVALGTTVDCSLPGFDVLSIDTDSRPLSAAEAYHKTANVARYVKQTGAGHIYKSIDSLLRGNLGAEIDALLDTFEFNGALIAPAFPHYGRITLNGIHYLNGKELAQSPVANDPSCPVKLSEITVLLNTQSDRAAVNLPVSVIRGSRRKFIEAVEKASEEGYELIVLDIETEDDLRLLAEHTFYLPDYLAVGSTGLAQYLAEGWWIPQSHTAPPVPAKTCKPVVIVSGSVSPITQDQICEIIKRSFLGAVCLNPVKLLNNTVEEYKGQIKKCLEENKNLLLYVDASDKARGLVKKWTLAKNKSAAETAEEIKQTLSKLAGESIKTGDVGGWILTGGDTAKAVCKELGYHGLELLDEVEPGIPVCQSIGDNHTYVVTKSGAFGTKEALLRCVSAIKKQTVPVVAITMGDPAGIGPEIIVKALTNPVIYQNCHPVVVGDSCILKRAIKIVGNDITVHSVKTVEDAEYKFGEIDCLDLKMVAEDLPFGKVSAKAGNAAFNYLKRAIELANDHRVQAICTAPLNKEAMQLGGHHYPGHTEILADLTGTKDFAMMFASEQLNVILVTIHVGLIKSVELVTPQSVYTTIKLAHETMRKKDWSHNPRIAVCGINPHAGENGLFGYGEEEKKIVPAILKAKSEGMDVTGPLPADTAFYLAKNGQYDIVVAMNHDQGLGPVKVLGIDKSVNITAGLPFIRTSVDHGTAFNIAGTGTADAKNMEEAIRQAWIMGHD